MIQARIMACGMLFAALLTGCGGSNSVNARVGGTVSGLAAGTVMLLNNGGNALTVSNGNFTFSQLVASQTAYNVTVASQPAGQTCVVSNGAGEIDFAGDAVGNVAIHCYGNVPVGVTVNGLTGGSLTVQLTLNNDPQTAVPMAIASNNPAGTFPNSLSNGTVYSVIVSSQPVNGQVCSIPPNSASGGVVVAQAAGLSAQSIIVAISCQ